MLGGPPPLPPLVVLPFFHGEDFHSIPRPLGRLHLHLVPSLTAQQGFPHRGLLADQALQGILPEGGDNPQGHFPVEKFVEYGHFVKKAHGIPGVCRPNALGGADHPFQVADTAVIAILSLLRAFIFKILTEIAKSPGSLDFLNQLGPQDPGAVVDLLPHFLQINLCQFVIHRNHSLLPKITPERGVAGNGAYPLA